MHTPQPDLPEQLQAALLLLSEGDAVEAARQYREADPDDQAGMLAFIDSGGPEMCRQLRVEHEDGTPTAASLERLLGA